MLLPKLSWLPQRHSTVQFIARKVSWKTLLIIRRNYSPFPESVKVDEHQNSQKSKSDHQALGTSLSLFTNHRSSPGAPFFSPDGTHIFQKLQEFLRAQYPLYGFQEVLTPIIYKRSLWVRSGHWSNYHDDMFTVTGRGAYSSTDATLEDTQDEPYGLKPMNCPGHCLLFKDQKRSYRDLPIRYAEFSPLHRNEVSGSLSGLTRLRRFHQDDGHIFCRPIQIGQEIVATLNFVRMVYTAFDLGSYKLRLCTRPKNQFIGEIEEWDRAEMQLKSALENSGNEFTINSEDGAFYGPKIDIILTDINGKEHQTATIQLDFQLPRQFKLEYQCPAPAQEAIGKSTTDRQLLSISGNVRPVIIHRAVLGSLERFMALLIERYQGRWPFWLSPRQLIILTVGNDPSVITYGQLLAKELTVPDMQNAPRSLNALVFAVHSDLSDRSISKKVREAKIKRYNIIAVIGPENVSDETIDLTLAEEPKITATWDVVEKIKPGFQRSISTEASTKHQYTPAIRLLKTQCVSLMANLCAQYL